MLPAGPEPEPIAAGHFPSRLHAFVWRNWESVETGRMAGMLGTSPDRVLALGRSMGLPGPGPVDDRRQQRGYVTLIRRNWHLLPYEQLLTLLDWPVQRLACALKEDDFLWVKLGMLKPRCQPLAWHDPTPAEAARAAGIAGIMAEAFGPALSGGMEPRFAFLDEFSRPVEQDGAAARTASPGAHRPVRFLYSYSAVYGDPLSDPALDPYPDGLLQRLASVGVNGVWLHTVLRDLACSRQFPEFGRGHETRLACLRDLVARAGRCGIDVYLYFNEPRSMPPAFFERYPGLAGHADPATAGTAMCSSTPEVQQWLQEATAFVFREVPGLGGVFTITMSENQTNCYSRAPGGCRCPRCAARSGPEVVAEVNRLIAAGVKAAAPDARVIVWDWGWPDDWAEAIIAALPAGVSLMSVSEWSLPIERGGVATTVGEYALSAPGPGPRASRHWRLARDRGLEVFAKVQVNCSWELSSLPYLPVMDLVAEHLANLAAAGVENLMLSWTLGGYPSPNLELVHRWGRPGFTTVDQALDRLAGERYGPAAGGHGRAAWKAFSDAFREYPFHVHGLYAGPAQVGPANLLYAEPTGYAASMVGFPYDALDQWRAVYPAEVFAGQFNKVADGWKRGLDLLRRALEMTGTPTQRAAAASDLRIAEAAFCHLKSVANQSWFTLSRDALRAEPDLPADRRQAHLDRMRRAAADEIELARTLFGLTRRDARIGFEATNHYAYYPLDLAEKVINCRDLLDRRLMPTGSAAAR